MDPFSTLITALALVALSETVIRRRYVEGAEMTAVTTPLTWALGIGQVAAAMAALRTAVSYGGQGVVVAASLLAAAAVSGTIRLSVSGRRLRREARRRARRQD